MFDLKNIIYVTSALKKNQWINDNIPEFCMIGRSNVGKSSLINFLTNNNKIAKISKSPGKTLMLNFFSCNNNQFRIVDAPGYGYAKVNNKTNIKFQQMMEEYLLNRKNLKFVFLLLDLRRIPNDDDLLIYNFLNFNNIKTIIIGTKLDKLKRNDILKNTKKIKDLLQLKSEIIKTSSLKKNGKSKVLKIIFQLLKLES